MLEWLQNPYAAIALAIGAMFFGYFFGLFEGRGQGYKRRQAEEVDKDEKSELEASPDPPTPTRPALPSDGTPLLDVSRDEAGHLRLKLDGQRIETGSLDSEERKRLIAVLTMIRPWLESVPQQPQPVRPAPTPAAPFKPVTAPEVRSVKSTGPTSTPAKEEEPPAAAPGSIVAQIDSILQAQLVGSPLFEKGIRLQESPEGGVIVWVGIEKYGGIEDVPDEQIKTALRAAITAWENKYTPGQ